MPNYNAETMMATVGTELDQVTQQILMYPNYIHLERVDGYVYPDNDLRTAAGIESGVLYKHPLCEGYSFKVVYDIFKFLARQEDNKKWYNLGLRMDDPFVEQWIAVEITIYDPNGIPIECQAVNIDPGIPPFEVFEPDGSSSGSGSDSEAVQVQVPVVVQALIAALVQIRSRAQIRIAVPAVEAVHHPVPAVLLVAVHRLVPAALPTIAHRPVPVAVQIPAMSIMQRL